jgi:mono/diheme cytochrome c family protein
MLTCHGRDRRCVTARLAATLLTAAALAACGGGDSAGSAGSVSTGTVADRGVSRTSLRVEAFDGDGDTLQYQWRATGGIIENRNSLETVWTVPDGPGLHFAYVVVSDGKGGYVEQQYAVATDDLRTTAPAKPTVNHFAPIVKDFAGTPLRLRLVSPDSSNGKAMFAVPGTGTTAQRLIYLPDVQVQVMLDSSIVFTGTSDLSGEVSLPKLDASKTYSVMCSTAQGSIPVSCRDSFKSGTTATVLESSPRLLEDRNLRLYGHIALVDGGVCGTQNEFFGMQSAATVQLQQADGAPLGAAVRVNRFGDYALDAAVAVKGSLKLRVQCESYVTTLNVPAPTGSGYASNAPVELSHQIPNSRPRVVKLVANGQDGNVRGEMVQLETPDGQSKSLPRPDHFLTYKGQDTRMSACMYYRSIGAVGDCNDQGNMTTPISFEDWKRQNQFKPYAGNNAEVSANYINKMDLNLVRRMVATKKTDDAIAFYVCNHPGPKGTTQAEVDQVLDTGLRDEKRVACVAMEWTVSPGVNGDVPLTKFLTFAPDGSLLPSINLDGRGEKYMPGACVACHGGTQYNGRFPDKGNPSPFLGAKFLPFDTGNYYFGSSYALTEQAQTDALYLLNQYVSETERTSKDKPDTATTRLVDGWYHSRTTKTLDKGYVPEQWSNETNQPGAIKFYREIIGSSCRTCHTALGGNFDVDKTPAFGPSRLKDHAGSRTCGGTQDLANNASMPNALVSRDRVAERIKADPELAVLMQKFLGCAAPSADPAYARR